MVKIRRGYRSKNVEYRGSAGGGGRGGLPFPMPQSRGGKAGAGLGGLGGMGLILALVLAFCSGGGGGGLGGLGLDAGLSPSGDGQTQGEVAETNVFLEVVFDDVQNTWDLIFESAGEQYQPSRLVIFRDSVSTGGCGNATAAVGPFYCPADNMVYLDQAFFDQLGSRFGAPGDFAQAYVIAHEIGHHIQNITGVSGQVRQQQQGKSQAEQNDLSVRLELQADCLAGVWGFQASRRAPTVSDGSGNLLYLERGDIEEGLAAAAAVGDDRLGAGAEHNWTHGSAAQREAWFVEGLETGDPGRCNRTFDDRASGTEIRP